MEANKKNMFVMKNPENANFNQYWFSTKTIEFLVEQSKKHGSKCAFVSTPSVFFSIKDAEFLKNCFVLEFDRKFEKNNPNFIFFDFNKPDDIPEQFKGFFDFVLIDPPFITQDVWEKYAKACKHLVKKNEKNEIIGKILLSSIDENEKMLQELLGVNRRKYRPSIPNLVYQYSFYSNYDCELLESTNPEIGF